MKKILAIVTITLLLAACNNSSEKTATDSKETVSAESPLTDAINTADSVTKKIQDTLQLK
jgi:uncharacterized protein YcfL